MRPAPSVASAVVLGSLIALATGPSNSVVVARQAPEVVASGLDNPRGLAFGPEGALYVVEAGRGGAGPCIPVGTGVGCFGLTGAVTRIWRGGSERIFSGLPSLAHADGQATGAHDISFQGRGNGYVIFGLGSNPANREVLEDAEPAAAILGRLARFTPGGRGSLVADIAHVEAVRNPDGGVPDTNPYAVLALPLGQVVADAGGNAVYGVLHNWFVLTLGVFPTRMVNLPFPPFTAVPMQAVPNSLALGPDGQIYVGELTGFPFPPGGARVSRLVPGHAPRVVFDGFTNIIDLAFGRDGSLFVLQFAANGLLNPPPLSSIVRVWPNGTRTTVDAPGLVAATGLAVGRDGALYVSNHGTSVGTGEVLRIVP